MKGEGWAAPVRSTSGRDSENNIIVYFGDERWRSYDGAGCRFYVSGIRVWGENYQAVWTFGLPEANALRGVMVNCLGHVAYG